MYIYIINKTKTSFLSRKRAITTFLSRKFMITRLSIAFEDIPGSSIASQVMPPCCDDYACGARLIFNTISIFSAIVFLQYRIAQFPS